MTEEEAFLGALDLDDPADRTTYLDRACGGDGAMRRILIDDARRKATARHGGAMRRQALDPGAAAAPEPREDLLALDEALDRLEAEDPLKARLVKLRYFAGLSLAEAAAALDLSERTAGRHWAYARAWLRRAVEGSQEKEE